MAEQHSYSGEYTNRYKFNGKELDEETGFYYYGARYYNPRFSIWLSTDPLAEKYPSFNPYNYCMQNPINLIDQTGMEPDDPLKFKMENYNNEKSLNLVAIIPSNYKNNTELRQDYEAAKGNGIPIMLVDDIKGFENGLNYLKSNGSDVSTFVISSHGRSGFFRIGNSEVEDNQADKNGSIKSVSHLKSLLSGSNIVISACNVGKGLKGVNFTKNLANTLNATVFTSQHLVSSGYNYNGNSSLNHDGWTLNRYNFPVYSVEDDDNDWVRSTFMGKTEEIYDLSINKGSYFLNFNVNDNDKKRTNQKEVSKK